MIIKKVRQSKYNKQKEITIPKESDIISGDYVAVFRLDKKLILSLNEKLQIIKLKEIIRE